MVKNHVLGYPYIAWKTVLCFSGERFRDFEHNYRGAVVKVRVLQAISLECIVLMLYLNPWCTLLSSRKGCFQMACLEDPPRSLVYMYEDSPHHDI